MSRPRLLDLFCGAGGAAMGYHRAGFEVVGVDIAPQPRYPFTFIQADAMTFPLHGYDAIHASPPCQAYTVAGYPNRAQGKIYPDLVAPTRAALKATGTPWVIENVPGSPIRADYRLCGCQFGQAELRRVRWFETSWYGYSLSPPCQHTQPAVSVAGHGEPSRTRRRTLGLPNSTVADWRRVMGIDWMNRDELSQAIPPVYCEFIGEQLLASLAVDHA